MHYGLARFNTSAARVAVWVAILFAAVTWKHDARTAALVVCGGFVGYCIEFYLFRLLVGLGVGRKPTRAQLALAALGLIGGAVFVYFGLSILLLLFISIWFILDAAVLKFVWRVRPNKSQESTREE
jgi:biotin transporter BioY